MRPETPDAVGDIIDRMHQTTSNIAQQRRAKMLSLSPAGNTSGAGTPTKDDVIRDLRAQIYALNMDMDTLKMDLADANERAAPSQRSREDVRRRDWMKESKNVRDAVSATAPRISPDVLFLRTHNV